MHNMHKYEFDLNFEVSLTPTCSLGSSHPPAPLWIFAVAVVEDSTKLQVSMGIRLVCVYMLDSSGISDESV